MEGARSSQAAGKRKRGTAKWTSKKAGRAVSIPRAINRLTGVGAVHVFKRSVRITNAATDWYQHSTYESALKMSVQLDMFPNYIEFSQLFDEYRIKQVTFTVYPSQINSEATGTGALGALPAQMSKWATVEEKTDDGAIAYGAMLNYGTYQNVLLDKKRSRTFKHPSVLTQLFRTALTTGYSPRASPWITSTNADVPHYCGKGTFVNAAAAATNILTYEIICTAVIETRNVR